MISWLLHSRLSGDQARQQERLIRLRSEARQLLDGFFNYSIIQAVPERMAKGYTLSAKEGGQLTTGCMKHTKRTALVASFKFMSR